MTDPAGFHAAIREEVSGVLIDNEDVVRGISIAALTGGHVLLEGVPGVAKTTIANLFARASGLEYNRIQMTPDILPADITGTHIYREQTGEFDLQRGPVFANVVVADEINRATPKTQSALLEAMQEGTVTIEGDTLSLPDPFMVIATQNPIEMEGTFALPEAQRDRFQLKLTVDLPGREMERELFDRFDAEPDIGPDTIEQVVSSDELTAARSVVADVHVAEPVREYILDLVRATRDSSDVEHGASPRATLAFLNTAKAAAAIDGREYVIPDDVKDLAHPVLRHRLVLSTDAELGGESVDDLVDEFIASVPVPDDAEADTAQPTTDRATDD
ncbi:MoxR family ATPase [Halolamina sp. CBA1230]|uniref:AAA family ATPase n=1 Tax=Halolamina sp. CBA1230 TaxID=1853690 RepID=UPI0009A1E650|nr:MoxR family ATPase [Halolamina sp. CBA1230]QKY20476.1 MoxR family ATPase [Halolamina sp. CBA1230]